MNQTIGIIGASGWIGRALATALRERGDRVIGFSRSSKEGWRQWDGSSVPDLSGIDVVINLAGEAIDQRWTSARKAKLHQSRVDLTGYLVKGMQESEVKVLLNASAVGIYGNRGEEQLTEHSEPGSGFLAQLCLDWEKAAKLPGTRVVLLRTGIVLGKEGRAWEKLSQVFRLGIGGRLGSGRQWMPWIHLADEIAAMIHCLDSDLSGPINLVAPQCERNISFTKKVAGALNRPAFFPAPAFALRLALGEFAREGLLASQRVVPEVLRDSGFRFRYPSLDDALAELTLDSVSRSEL